MDIRTIELDRVMVQEQARVEFPEAGLIVVTGENGQGKSTLTEAVSSAFWGKTLRGTPWWRKKGESTVFVETERLAVTRTRKSGKESVSIDGLGEAEHDTATKAQQALDPIVGTHDGWRQTSIFSSQDADNFTTATDAGRKKLIEQLLGLERFDPALKEARGDLKRARMHYAKAEGAYSTAQARLEGARKREVDLAEWGGGEVPPEPDNSRMSKLVGMRKSIREDIAAQQADLGQLQRRLGAAQAELRAARRAVGANPESCPTCGQAMPEDARAHALQHQEEAEAKAVAVEREVSEDIEALKAALEELNEELEAADAEHRKLADQTRARSAWEREEAKRAKLADSIKTDIRAAEKAAQEAEAALIKHGVEVQELEAVEAVLGLRGVRAHVLHRALKGIEAVANAWLARIFPGVSIVLKPSRARSSGKGTVDRITLEVAGLPHDHGYAAVSGGQRRRLDVAILLALADVRSAAEGTEPGTLWFDEVFDIVDAAGVETIIEVLTELSADRAIVVITHNPSLAESLPATLRLRAANGTLEEQ